MQRLEDEDSLWKGAWYCMRLMDPIMASAWHWEDYIGAHEAKQEILAHEQNLQVAALLHGK